MSNDVIYEEVIENPYGFIYITTNMCDGKRYLGQKKFDNEWQNYLGSGTVFKRAVKKYGKENFVRNIIDIAYSDNELNQKEYDYSVFLNVVDSNDWYNLVYGGGTTTGYHASNETKRKIGNKAKERFANPENHPMYGKDGLKGESNPMFGISPKERMDKGTYEQWYDNHKEYWDSLSDKMKGKHMWKDDQHPLLGKHHSEETRKKISDAAKKRYAKKENNPMYGKHLSEETKRKIKENRPDQSGANHPNSYQVLCVETNQVFGSVTDAGKAMKIRRHYISDVCKGNRDNVKGYHFKYISKQEYNEIIDERN